MKQINKMQMLQSAKGQNVYACKSGMLVIGNEGLTRREITKSIYTSLLGTCIFALTFCIVNLFYCLF